MSKELPLVDGILDYVQKNKIAFCMPGHKSGLGFLTTSKGNEFYRNFINCDITEVDGTDNLHCPEGIIKQAQELLREFYGSRKSYFLVNGSTSGNLAMIFSAFNEGDKVIVERNCHRSIINGIILRKLKPVYIRNEINKKYNAPLSIDRGHFLHIIEEHKDAKGIIITYPNYYGICMDLEFVIKKAKEKNMAVLVDSAHGAHFPVTDELPKSAVELGADMVVTSSHKTLPSLTQTAYLHVNNKSYIEKTDFYVSAFLSTSPSYLLMCSMDYARYYMENGGKEDFKKLIGICREYKEKINKLEKFHILSKEDLGHGFNIDESRYIINVSSEFSASSVMDYLNDNGIQCEMNDGHNIILIFAPFNNKNEFEKLYTLLEKCQLSNMKQKYFENVVNHVPKLKLLPYETINKDKEIINFKDSVGRIVAKSIVPYPPGIPIVIMGEIMDNESIELIKYYIKNNVSILGLDNEGITAIKE